MAEVRLNCFQRFEGSRPALFVPAPEFCMHAINSRPMASHRFWRVAVAALVKCVLLPGLATAQPPSITVTGGSVESVPGTYASGTYTTVTVSGTGAAGERSTLTIDASLQMGQDFDGGNQVLSVTDGGLLNVNANVTAATLRSGTVGNGGTLNLLSGTFQLTSLDLSGTAAFQRAPGAVWAIDSLSLSDGATVTYTAGDLWGGGGYYPFLGISSGATLELQTNLVAPFGSDIYLRDPGSQILRATGTETISGGIVVTDGANVTLIAGDTPDALVAGELYGTDPVAPSEITLVPGTTTLNLSYLGLGRGGSIVGLADASYNVKAVSVAGQKLDYRSGDSITEYVGIAASGTLFLQKNLTLSGSYAQLSLSGSTSTLERDGFTVTAPSVYLYEGANLTIGDGITVSRGISVNGGFEDLPTAVTLTENLVLSASDGVSPSIFVSGSSSGILRATPGLTITATGAAISSYGQGAFTMEAGDDFTGSSVNANDGGIIANAGPQTLASVQVYGTDSTYTANAPLTIAGGEFGVGLFVSYGGIFHANANVTASSVAVTSGTLDLVSGTLSTASSMSLSGSGAIAVNRAGGAAYQVGGQLSLDSGASLEFIAGTDSIASLFLDGGFLTTSGSGGLTLTDLNIMNGGLLTLDSFDGVGGPGDWALKLPDSYASSLSTYVSGSSIIGGAGQPLNVVQQDGFAYVTAVPEPSAIVLALGGVGIVAGLIRRRSRTARRGQPVATTSGRATGLDHLADAGMDGVQPVLERLTL